MKRSLFVLGFLLSLTVLFGCKSTWMTSSPTGQPGLSVEQFLDSVATACHFNALRSKISVNFTSEKESRSFSVRARLRKDSIIWLSITPGLGIEVFRLVITPDSIKMLNRLDKKYFSETFDKANEILKIDADFYMLQSVLTGGFVKLYDEDTYKVTNIPGQYVIEADLSQLGEKGNQLLINQRADMDPSLWRITRSLLNNTAKQEQITAEYKNFQQLQSMVFPTNMHFNIQAKENAVIDLNWSKIEEKNTLRFPFSIPAKYVAY